MNKILIFGILTVFLIGFVSSLNVESVTVDTVSPGQEGIIRIGIENEGNSDIDRLSVELNFNNPNIIPVGSSEEFLDTLDEGEDESFIFRFKVSNILSAGTYSLQYDITYEEDNSEVEQNGAIGIIVSAEPEIEITANAQNSIVGSQGELEVRIVNKGLADARFVDIQIESDDLVFLSGNSEYIGTIDSDDFETSSFDVIYSNKFPSVVAKITYKDFNNNEQEIIKTMSLRAYTSEEAIEKGILTKSNAPTYVGIILLLFVLWILYRSVKKRLKKRD